MAQINTKLGDLDYNVDKINATIRTYGPQSDLIVFPEMSISWYPLNDLLDDEDMVKRQKSFLPKIQEEVMKINDQLKVVFWFIDYNEQEKLPSGEMKKFNAAAVIGSDIQTYHKHLLPTYDVFFEQRYFAPGKDGLTFRFGKDLVGALTICEDIWDEYYDVKPIQHYKNKGVDVVLNISSSPFGIGKIHTRKELLEKHSKDIQANMIYLNQVGAQDELVFDGWSMMVNPQGELIHFSPRFQEDIQIIDTDTLSVLEDEVLDENKYEVILEAITLGLKDYLGKTGIKDVVIGVSGGIDSAVDLYFASQVLAPERIHAIYMPTQYNTNQSWELSKQLCDGLGIDLQVGEIQDLLQSYEKFHEEKLGKKAEGITHENIQARIRGNILMGIANDVQGMVINNSNKTELAMGYGTLYGDLIWGLALIGDLNKKEVYELSKYINQKEAKEAIPQWIITRKASAELKDNQVDPFDYDKVSEAIEELQFGASIPVVAEKYGLPLEEVKAMRRRIKINEFKIRQAPPVIKLKNRSVGIGRMYPIVE
jgi:NAD+ synthase (glutamine-hydrolysing)